MRILYGVVGEGMGHATRSRVVIEHLVRAGHELLIVVSGRAHAWLASALEGTGARVEEIEGLSLVFDEDGIDKSETAWTNIADAPRRLKKNLEVYAAVTRSFSADAVISDFESWAYLYARANDIPVVSIDNMQILNRCAVAADLRLGEESAFRIAKWAVKAKLPGAYHYLVSAFYFSPTVKPRTTYIPPILRPAVLAATRKPSDHIVVYQTKTAGDAWLEILGSVDAPFVVYGAGREGSIGNVTLRPFSETGFVDDLASARAVVASAGFSLMSEAVHLKVPMLALPIAGQFEQTFNARVLDRVGYGQAAPELSAERLVSFLEQTDSLQQRLESAPRFTNAETFACVDELLKHIGRDEPAVERLEASLGLDARSV